MLKTAAVIEDGMVVNVIVVDAVSGQAVGLRNHPLKGKVEIPPDGMALDIGMIKAANGFERRPELPDQAGGF